VILATVIDWEALGDVVLYSVVAGIGVPAIYALAVLGAARSTEKGRGGGLPATAYALLSLLGGAACLAAIGFAVYLMTQK